jgi:hypothetical protein
MSSLVVVVCVRAGSKVARRAWRRLNFERPVPSGKAARLSSIGKGVYFERWPNGVTNATTIDRALNPTCLDPGFALRKALPRWYATQTSNSTVLLTLAQSRDSSLTFLHLHQSHHADLLEDFSRLKLPAEEIYVPPQHQPINPDDEDDIVPDQHAAFGIQRATQKVKEPAWRDLGLDRLMSAQPPNNSKDGRPRKALR